MSKRKIIASLFYLLAVIFVVGFAFLLWQDYVLHYPYGSAPFYVYVIERAFELLLPAGLCVAAGIAVKKRGENHVN